MAGNPSITCDSSVPTLVRKFVDPGTEESQMGGNAWEVLGVPQAPPDNASHDVWAAYCVEWYRQFASGLIRTGWATSQRRSSPRTRAMMS